MRSKPRKIPFTAFELPEACIPPQNEGDLTDWAIRDCCKELDLGEDFQILVTLRGQDGKCRTNFVRVGSQLLIADRRLRMTEEHFNVQGLPVFRNALKCSKVVSPVTIPEVLEVLLKARFLPKDTIDSLCMQQMLFQASPDLSFESEGPCGFLSHAAKVACATEDGHEKTMNLMRLHSTLYGESSTQDFECEAEVEDEDENTLKEFVFYHLALDFFS